MIRDQQYHGVADSSLRRGQIGPGQDGLRDMFVMRRAVMRIAFGFTSVDAIRHTIYAIREYPMV